MEKINIAELLKDCPKGMELDCILFNNPVKLVEIADIDEYPCPITVTTVDGDIETFTKYGQYLNRKNAKCIIFPKGKTTWERFVPPVEFKTGDVLYTVTDEGEYRLCIVDCIIGDTLYTKTSCSCNGHFLCTCEEQFNIEELVVMRLATEEEKQKLFDAIKENGYKWNAGTKTLEKLVEPKFKVGDRIRHKEETKWTCVIRRIDDRYWVDKHPTCYTILFDKQDEYELVPDKFDINTLYPLQPVLVRNTNGQVWTMDFFSHKIDTNKGLQPSIVCVSHCPNQCIPYKNNEFLRGTTDDCKDFYKIWEL